MELLAQVTSLIDADRPSESLRQIAEAFPGEVVFSSSFSAEDQVISHLILDSGLPVEIFSLDTGRMFAESYEVWNKTNAKYKTKLKAYFPEQTATENLISQKGLYSFYESIENRKECCFIRKVAPLKRALAGKKIWITGIRAEHSSNREQMPALEWDESNGLLKYHPLLHWSHDRVWDFIRQHKIPYNILHDKGYPSIGCQPCTRAVAEGEDMRAGRWWWENTSGKECGLHQVKTPESKT